MGLLSFLLFGPQIQICVVLGHEKRQHVYQSTVIDKYICTYRQTDTRTRTHAHTQTHTHTHVQHTRTHAHTHTHTCTHTHTHTHT